MRVSWAELTDRRDKEVAEGERRPPSRVRIELKRWVAETSQPEPKLREGEKAARFVLPWRLSSQGRLLYHLVVRWALAGGATALTVVEVVEAQELHGNGSDTATARHRTARMRYETFS